jgi:hypothetical protein
MDLGSPNLGTLAPTTNHNVTSPLFTPGEAEEDPMATAESNASKQKANPKSEKAKGKMRERSESTSTLAMDTELQRLAMSGIGPNGYVPTQEWVSSWQKGYVNGHDRHFNQGLTGVYTVSKATARSGPADHIGTPAKGTRITTVNNARSESKRH